MQKLLIHILFLLTLVSANAATYSVDQIPNVQVQDHTKHLVNPDGIVSAPVAAQIDTLLMDIRRQTSCEVVAVIVDDIDSDVDVFATELFNNWRIGKSDNNNGVLILVAKDARRGVIRTGYGAEGVLPDAVCANIRRDIMFEHFKQDDYDGGMLAGVQAVHDVLTNPEYAEELRSSNKEYSRDGQDIDVLDVYLKTAGGVAIGLLIFLAFKINALSSKDKKYTDYQKYVSTSKMQNVFLISGVAFVGIPLIAFLVLWLIRRHWRNHARKCPRCGAGMNKLPEEQDNDYLTYAQDLEEKIKSVDYDVWLCPKCGETDIYSFVANGTGYTECPICKAHTRRMTGVRVLREPTYKHEGLGEKVYTCLNCEQQSTESYTIAKKEPPVVVVGGGGRGGLGGGGFGGGSFGGGFGGGLTGGGGSSGGW